MPVPTQFGVLAGHGGGSGFVTQHAYSSDTTQVVSFSGAAAGNLAVVIETNASGTTLPTGWTLVSANILGGNRQVISYKVLSAGDISTGSVSFTNLSSNSTVMAAFYSGPTTASNVSSTSTTTGTTVSIPGFTKNAASKAVVTYGANIGDSTSITPPGLAVSRIASIVSPSFPFNATALADITPSSGYTNGTALVWSGFPNNGGAHAGEIIELV